MKNQLILSGLVMAFLASTAALADGDSITTDSQQNGQSQTAPQSGMPEANTQSGHGSDSDTDTTAPSSQSGTNGSY